MPICIRHDEVVADGVRRLRLPPGGKLSAELTDEGEILKNTSSALRAPSPLGEGFT